MEVVEWEPNRTLGMITQDGSMEIHGRTTFEEIGESRTRLTLDVDMPVDESMKNHFEDLIRQSTEKIKELIESET